MTQITDIDRARAEEAIKTCGGCEYFDRHHGDCLRSSSPRFQAEPNTPACHLFYPDTTAEGQP